MFLVLLWNCSCFCSENFEKLLLQSFPKLHQKQSQQNNTFAFRGKIFSLKHANHKKAAMTLIYAINFIRFSD